MDHPVIAVCDANILYYLLESVIICKLKQIVKNVAFLFY